MWSTRCKKKVIIPFDYGYIGEYRDGLALVSTLSGKCGFINTKGEFVIEPKYDEARDFHEGLAAVQVGNKWGFINVKGDMVIQPTFDAVEWFNDGLAPVELNERWGFIDAKGNLVIQPIHDGARFFSEGLAMVSFDGNNGFIDTKGKIVLNISDLLYRLGYTSRSYWTLSYFENGLLAVYLHRPFGQGSDLVGYIDKKGTPYWKD